MGNIDNSVFIAEGARLVGDITIGKDSVVMYNAVVRADKGLTITVGTRSSIQDCCMLHAGNNCSITIGDNVTIGHAAIVHGCTIQDNTTIGMGAIIMNKAVIGRNCLVGAGALVTERKVIPDGSLVVGSPAKVVRALTEAEIVGLQGPVHHYTEIAKEAKEKETEE